MQYYKNVPELFLRLQHYLSIPGPELQGVMYLAFPLCTASTSRPVAARTSATMLEPVRTWPLFISFSKILDQSSATAMNCRWRFKLGKVLDNSWKRKLEGDSQKRDSEGTKVMDPRGLTRRLGQQICSLQILV